jgi:hypothetical protein
MPDADRRWSGAFRTCAACGKRNFVGRVACTACGASLRSLASAAPPPPAAQAGRRGSDRIQGRGLAIAAGAVALVAIAGGVLVSRSLRAPDWARFPGSLAEVVARPSRASSPEAASPPAPAFPRPEDRARYEQGRRLLAAGEVKRAVGPLGDAARGLPQDAAVAHDFGLALLGAGDRDRGLFQLEHASRLAPGIESYRLDLIRALLAAGRRGPAARELQELLARDPTNQSAAEMLVGLAATTGGAGGQPAPGATPSSMDLGGAASGSGSPRPGPAGGAFTNEDLGRRPAAPTPSAISPSPAPPVSPGPAR